MRTTSDRSIPYQIRRQSRLAVSLALMLGQGQTVGVEAGDDDGDGGLVDHLRGSLAPEGAVVKIAGIELVLFEGTAA